MGKSHSLYKSNISLEVGLPTQCGNFLVKIAYLCILICLLPGFFFCFFSMQYILDQRWLKLKKSIHKYL